MRFTNERVKIRLSGVPDSLIFVSYIQNMCIQPEMENRVKVTNKSKKSIHISQIITPYRKMVNIKYKNITRKYKKNYKMFTKSYFFNYCYIDRKGV